MATTTIFQPNTNAYILVVSGTSNEFFLQNTSNSNIMVVWGDSFPAAEDRGYVVGPGQGLVRNGTSGQVYARAMNTEGRIIVTEA